MSLAKTEKQQAEIVAKTEQQQAEIVAKNERKPWADRIVGATAGALICATVSGVLTLGSTAVDHRMTPPTTDTVTACSVAQQGVKKALDIGVDNPKSLEPINPESVDRGCGEETVIACDILDGLDGQIPKERAATARKLGC
jgi:hypothetical protein